MAKNLVISQGTLHKKAQGLPGEGPSFEQQFGILANAQITDKYPALGPYKVLFQLQDKSDDNLFAVGSAVYKLGDNFTYIPAVFKKGKIWTGVIQYVPAMQRFLPLSDAWLSYVKNHNIPSAGDIVPADLSQDIATDASTARAKLSMDPFMKTASYLTVFDLAIKMGKKASLVILDKLNDIDYLNGALAFYLPLVLASFAKKASQSFLEIKPYIITVMDKRAALLSSLLKSLLFRDGFIIKTALNKVSTGPATLLLTVIKSNNPRTSFIKPDRSCKCKVLCSTGDLKDVIIIKSGDVKNELLFPGLCAMDTSYMFGVSRDVPAKKYIKNNSPISFNIVTDLGYKVCPSDILVLADSILDTDITKIGQSFLDIKLIPFDSLVITPSGLSFKIKSHMYKSLLGGHFYNSVLTLTISDDLLLVKTLISSNHILVPKGSRIVFKSSFYKKDGTRKNPSDIKHVSPPLIATTASIDSTIRKFILKNYDKVKVYSDGHLFTVSSSKLDGTNRMQIKLAALHLVTAYKVNSTQAKAMLNLVLTKCAGKVSHALTYFITKTAAIPGDTSSWLLANIGMTVLQEDLPLVSKTDLNNYALNSLKIMHDVELAALVGVKLVFDMQVLRLLLETADPRLLISLAIPLFMNCLDKLCRLLYIYHCHTDDMLLQYGAVKMQALAKSLLNTLKDLSLLAVFLKLRGISNDTNNNPDVGDLLTGSYL